MENHWEIIGDYWRLLGDYWEITGRLLGDYWRLLEITGRLRYTLFVHVSSPWDWRKT